MNDVFRIQLQQYNDVLINALMYTLKKLMHALSHKENKRLNNNN